MTAWRVMGTEAKILARARRASIVENRSIVDLRTHVRIASQTRLSSMGLNVAARKKGEIEHE